MKEELLYYIWQYKLFSTRELFTTNNNEIAIQKLGERNHNTGPDFLNAQILLNHQLWAGNIEMHVKSSDWYLHNHEKDPNYDAVILHVVWEHDVEVFIKNNTPLSTIELKRFVAISLLHQYEGLMHNKEDWIPCGRQIIHTDKFLLENWLERLYFERLEQKSILIHQLLQKSNFDFEAVLFQLLAKNFGLNVNGDAFLKLASSIDFIIIKKVSFHKKQLEALLFGQAGLLREDSEVLHEKELKSEYEYLKHKYKLKPLQKNTFQFFRMRPNNFPTIRIAQLTTLLYTHQNLFSKIIKIQKKEDFYKFFAVEVDSFWKEHYTFTTTSKKSNKKVTKAFVDLLLINTIIPLKFVYLQNRSDAFEDVVLGLIRQVVPEKNSVIEGFSNYGIQPKSGMESQALLMLKNNYCTKKRCLHCAIGNHLLKK